MSYCLRWPPGARAQRGSPVLYHPSPQLCPAPAQLSTHCSRSAVHPLEPQAAAAPPLRQLNTLRCFHTDHRLATRHHIQRISSTSLCFINTKSSYLPKSNYSPNTYSSAGHGQEDRMPAKQLVKQQGASLHRAPLYTWQLCSARQHHTPLCK